MRVILVTSEKKEFKENRQKILVLTSLIFLLLFTLSIRYHTFWLAHWLGDQRHYLALAAKLEKFGFDHYNLRGIHIRYRALDGEETLTIGEVQAASREGKGDILEELESLGIRYYDLDLHHIAPAFPYMLMFSHKLFRKEGNYSAVVTNLGEWVKIIKPLNFFQSQFYAVIVPLCFSLLLICLTYYLGKEMFSPRVGLYAAFLIAINPVDILTSQKIWADDMLAVFVVLSILLWVISRKKQNLCLALLAGMSCGVAVLTKQTGGVVLFAIWLHQVMENRKGLKNLKQWSQVFFGPYFLMFCGGLLIASGGWFLKVFQTYGNPVYRPPHSDILRTDKSGWFRMLADRPHPLILYLVGIPYLSPLFLLAYLTVRDLWSKGKKMLGKDETSRSNIILLWLWFAVFLGLFFLFSKGKEHRYMLPTYPALAILSACVLHEIRKFLTQFTDRKIISDGAIIILLLLSAWWSIPIGFNTILANGTLILEPF